MIYITQLIYVKHGQESAFDEFEAIALPLIAKYNGKLLLRIRPSASAIIDASIEHPYELHLVEFNADTDLENFMKDEERKKFIYLKEQSIEKVVLVKGAAM
ncbi:MAG TPA: DUF1330 domain-containing protein [Cyclobacteriaceae bacterium]|nr:DUF1330 domain-containing protein [Cyclobacteriaceae bacterium]